MCCRISCFNLQFPKDNNVKNISTGLFAIYIFSLVRCLFRPFVHFQIKWFVFLLLMGFVYVGQKSFIIYALYKYIYFNKVQLTIFFLSQVVLSVFYLKLIIKHNIRCIFLHFFSRSIIVLNFTFRSIKYFELILWKAKNLVQVCLFVCLLLMYIQLFHHHLWKKLSFPH